MTSATIKPASTDGRPAEGHGHGLCCHGRGSGQPASKNPRPVLAAAGEMLAYRWPLPGKITARPAAIPVAGSRNSSSE